MSIRFGPAWIALLVATAVALLIRHQWIEPVEFGLICQADPRPWHCNLRDAVIWSFAFNGLGYFSVLCGVVATILRSRRFAFLGAFVGVFGIVLYCSEWSAVGLTLSVLALARLQSTAREDRRNDHGQGEQHA